MRCPVCNLELNPLSERCPNCGTSARRAKPDGDTMTRVRRQIAVVRGEREVSDEDLSDTSFSPVLKFERPDEKKEETEKAGAKITDNPADHFETPTFTPVDIIDMVEDDSESEAQRRHRTLSSSIRHIQRNKEDDLLAEYYFKDGISDLERLQLERSFAELEKEEAEGAGHKAFQGGTSAAANDTPQEQEMSEAAKRLSEFPEESGIDKVLTSIGETYDALVLKGKQQWNRLIHGRLGKIYNGFDRRTAPFLDKLLEKFYYVKFKDMRRRKADDAAEKRRLRRHVWSVCGVLLAVAVCAFLFIGSLFSEPINGKWIVSYDVSGAPNILMEFKPGGGASISVKSEDGWHIHRQGRYRTQRKNGHDMLTITYEDGSVARLYYEIDGKTGTFINVDTNMETQYTRK